MRHQNTTKHNKARTVYIILGVYFTSIITWWRHQMKAFSALLAICAGNSPVPGEFPSQRPVTRSFVFDLRLNKRLSKQWRGWWFETLSRPLWRQCNIPCHTSTTHISGVWRRKQVSRAGTNNYISQILWNVIIFPCVIPASGTTLLTLMLKCYSNLVNKTCIC